MAILRIDHPRGRHCSEKCWYCFGTCEDKDFGQPLMNRCPATNVVSLVISCYDRSGRLCGMWMSKDLFKPSSKTVVENR